MILRDHRTATAPTQGPTFVAGFVAAGIHCGIKTSGALDLSLVATGDGHPVRALATFTANRACAAPVRVSRAHLESSHGAAAGVVVNSGNANAATGAAGMAVAEEATALVAAGLGCHADQVLVCSTGLIGIPLAADPFRTGVPMLVAALDADGGPLAAAAIMTTDTVAKLVEVEVADDDEHLGFRIGGMAKGAAMLAPNMATMLAVLTTDAEIDRDDPVLARAVAESFNRLSVDGCTSTNDTVILLANGNAGRPDAAVFEAGLTAALRSLARQMCDDAEGATKTVTITVTGATDDAAADAAARKVADSNLCKCSWYGNDPYWGRILSELGTAGVELDEDTVSIAYGGTVVSRGLEGVTHDHAAVTTHMEGRELEITCDLGVGTASAWILTNDLTHAYIDENRGTS